ncbi:MAG: hypothetical protein RRX92_00050 [Lachnospiraceae bacterium]
MKQWIQMSILTAGMIALIGIMYPKYCFADGTYRIIMEESGVRHEVVLQEKDYQAIFRAQPGQIHMRSRILDYITSGFVSKDQNRHTAERHGYYHDNRE